MHTLHTIFLIIHITFGAFGLITGSINILRRKGDRMHARIGLAFFYSMLVTGMSALILSFIHPNAFLAIIGVFTIYMVCTGYRYIRLRMTEVNNAARSMDWALTIGMAIAGILFFILGLLQFFKGNFFGVVYTAFGMVGWLFVKADVSNYREQAKHRNYWLLAHLQRMTGAYIAALTAFLVVNSNALMAWVPGWVFWLLPTAILTPFIIRWSNNYGVLKS